MYKIKIIKENGKETILSESLSYNEAIIKQNQLINEGNFGTQIL